MANTAHLEESLVLGILEVARLIGRTELATRRVIQRGQLPARKLGGRVVVLRAEFLEFLHALPQRGDAVPRGDDHEEGVAPA
jgi:hypothetical protein